MLFLVKMRFSWLLVKERCHNSVVQRNPTSSVGFRYIYLNLDKKLGRRFAFRTTRDAAYAPFPRDEFYEVVERRQHSHYRAW